MLSSSEATTRKLITILYGSQTGNAEDVAKRVGLQAKMLDFKVLVQTMDDFNLKELPKQNIVIFICSTTGHGQEPENMRNLFNFMRRKDLPKNCLSKLNFVVFGLGDSSYTKFNYVSKILFKRLRECGANPLLDLTASDEQHPFGCDGMIYPKLSELWNKITINDNQSGNCIEISKPSITDMTTDKLPPTYSVALYEENDGPHPKNKYNNELKKRYNLKEALCIKNKRVTAQDHFQDTRFFCFKNTEPLSYKPGDVCTIYPQNSQNNVDEFINLLNLNPQQRVRFEKLDPNYMVNYLYDFIPDGIKIKDLVRYYLDIQSVPKRSFFEYLWQFGGSELERDKLKEFASTEGQEEVYEYCIRPKRSILETLMDFPCTVKNIEFVYLLDMIPPIKPRSFSIASSSNVHPNEIHLIVGVVNYRTIMKKSRQGLCSNYLANMNPISEVNSLNPESSTLSFFVRNTSFKLPRDNLTPIIMVGPGLGIAPFRGFIEDRLQAKGTDSKDGAELNHLYFGCRFEQKDFYFKEELQRYSADSNITLRLAFSRTEPKRYVQNLIESDAYLIKRLINSENAVFYVAGNSKLPEELRLILANLFANDAESEFGEKIVAELEASNRLQYDCW